MSMFTLLDGQHTSCDYYRNIACSGLIYLTLPTDQLPAESGEMTIHADHSCREAKSRIVPHPTSFQRHPT